MKTNYRLTTLLGVIVALVLVACSKPQDEADVNPEKEKYQAMFQEAFAVSERCPDSTFVYVDSIEATGQYPDYLISLLRGGFYNDQGNFRLTEFYTRKALCKELHDIFPGAYYNATHLLGVSLLNKSSLEEALRVSEAGYEEFQLETDPNLKDLGTQLLSIIGACQLKLRQRDEGDKTMQRCYDELREIAAADTSYKATESLALSATNIASVYSGEYPEAAMPWIERSEESLDMLAERDKESNQTSMEPLLRANLQLVKAMSYAKNGQLKEAKEAYDTFMAMPFASNPQYLTTRLTYLEKADQWAAAADLLPTITELLEERGLDYTMDYLSAIAECYQVYEKAGRNAEATKMARQLALMVDSVRLYQQKDDAAELAVVYAVQQKDQEIAEQQASLLRQRLIGLLVALILITLFFVVYTLYRRRVTRRMTELKTAQERIENELKIARNIQMSMVPSSFPEREGLDMYASMVPAKEVGGDLYGYVLQGDILYFCLGDVSGKGVPASLLMAQATRLFRTLALQNMEPAAICTNMNDQLSGEDNVNGMFITMFVGMLDLETGHLRFCNAGHNPPIIGGGDHHGDFLKMEPNIPIGIMPGMEFKGEEIDTIKGRPLFVYTDGLNEAEDTNHKQFGDDRLLDILRNTRFNSAKQVIETLTEEVNRHRNGAEPNDDLTMFCLRVS